MFYDLPSVTIEGDRLSGRSMINGSDWMLAGEDGWSRIDVRVPVETVDGALIYVQYEGWIEPTEKLIAAVKSLTPTSFGDRARLESSSLTEVVCFSRWSQHALSPSLIQVLAGQRALSPASVL
jgi:hypothetical protein